MMYFKIIHMKLDIINRIVIFDSVNNSRIECFKINNIIDELNAYNSLYEIGFFEYENIENIEKFFNINI